MNATLHSLPCSCTLPLLLCPKIPFSGYPFLILLQEGSMSGYILSSTLNKRYHQSTARSQKSQTCKRPNKYFLATIKFHHESVKHHHFIKFFLYSCWQLCNISLPDIPPCQALLRLFYLLFFFFLPFIFLSTGLRFRKSWHFRI